MHAKVRIKSENPNNLPKKFGRLAETLYLCNSYNKNNGAI
jgi:hypothetical protein